MKTDAVDAETLAHLLRAGLLPEAYIAPTELRDLRDLLRHRATLVHLRTWIKNRVHAMLARQGVLPEHSDLFGTAGRAYLAGLAAAPRAPPTARQSDRADQDFDREITQTASEIDQRAKADERVKRCARSAGRPLHGDADHRQDRRGHRFPTAKHLCQWAGLTPTVRSSDGKASLGHISRQGSTILRWALCEAASPPPPAAGHSAPNMNGSPNAAAADREVAVARQILTLSYYGLRDGEIRCLTHQPDDVNERAGGPRMTLARRYRACARPTGAGASAASSFLCLASPSP